MKKIIIFLSIFLLGNLVFAQNIYKLDNGQTVIIKEIHTNPIVTIDTWVKTGSINENEKNNGVSHFLEHLFFKGTTTYAPGEFDKILESKGAVNNAATSKDFTHYYITIPSKYFDLALKMHADMLQNPLVPGKEMEKERKVVLEEISKDINSPTTKVYNNLISMMYTDHPYKRKVIGESSIIENITREEILSYFNKYYAPSNMVTVIAGDVDSQIALKGVQKYFSKEYKKIPQNKYLKEKQLTKQLKKIDYAPIESGYMFIGFRTVKTIDKDSYALDVLAAILGEGKSSVFYQNIKDKKQLAFNISASNSTMKDDGIFYVSANFIPENCKKLENSIFSEIKEIQINGVSQEQLELAKNLIEKDTYYARESISNIAQEIGYTMVTTDDIKYYENYLQNIKKVTESDVKRVANKYLDINKSAVSVILPEDYKEVKISNIKPFDTTAKLISKNNQTEKYILSNGAVLLFTPNTANDISAINIYAKGGEFIEKIPGTGKLMASVMLKGTKNYSSAELSEFMENNGIKIIPNSKADAFSINVLTTKSELAKTLEILDEIVNNALFDEYEINKAVTEKINSIKKNRDIPLQKAIEEYNTLIYKDSVYSNSTKILEKTFPTIQYNDLIEYYNTIFNPKNLVISVNGNVNKDEIIKAVTKIFKQKPTELFDYNCYTIPAALSPRVSNLKDKNTETAWIFLGWQTDGIQNRKDYAALQIIDTMLGNGMSSRLFKNLREQEGLAYQLGSNYSPSMKKGNLVLFIGTNSKNLEHAKAKLFEEIKKLKTEYVGTKELQDAKEKLLGQFVISQETNLEKASTIGWFEASGRGYDFDYDKLVNSITESDIIEVANKYFNNNYTLSIVTN